MGMWSSEAVSSMESKTLRATLSLSSTRWSGCALKTALAILSAVSSSHTTGVVCVRLRLCPLPSYPGLVGLAGGCMRTAMHFVFSGPSATFDVMVRCLHKLDRGDARTSTYKLPYGSSTGSMREGSK